MAMTAQSEPVSAEAPPGGSQQTRTVAPRQPAPSVWLVLHEPDDAGGSALASALERCLQRLGLASTAAQKGSSGPQVLAISSLALRMKSSWALRVDKGGTQCRLVLADGQVLDDAVLVGVVNRIGPVRAISSEAESCYQSSEWSALMLAWLFGLRCPVINRPRPMDPYPQLHDHAWWCRLASNAGLGISATNERNPIAWGLPSNSAACLVMGQQVVPDAAQAAAGWKPDLALTRALCRLAARAGRDMLTVHGDLDARGLWRFQYVESQPDVGAFGEAGEAALAQALRKETQHLETNTREVAIWQRPSALAQRAGLVAVLGRPAEGPCNLLLTALKRQGAPAVVLDQRRLGPPEAAWFNRLCDQEGKRVCLDRVHGLYLRPVDHRSLGLATEEEAAAAAHAHAWGAFAEWAPMVVVNPLSAMASNSSKPLQSQVLASLGFSIPPMLLTTSPLAVSAFEAEHGQLVFKSASGVRSIVCPLDAAARGRLEQVRHAPTLFQKRLHGTNLRVHVVGEAVFATEIDSGAIDYRYAGRDGAAAELRATQLPLQLEGLCRRAAEQLGLRFAGLDLMLAEDGQVYCFEVNPSPGYSWYEDATGQGISGALAALLSGQQA